MKAFAIHPNVYATSPLNGLIRMLEQVWVRDHEPGNGTFYIISGFGNYNGGVRFFEVFREHISKGGKIVSFFAGSTAQNLTSKQLIREMLGIGAEVHIVNRKRLLHAKCYGSSTVKGEQLIVTSGNFTGPGMSQNVEAAVLLDNPATEEIGFSWDDLVGKLKGQNWDRRQPKLDDERAPVWQLLYDEFSRDIILDKSEETTLVMTLGHADTARIQASPGTSQAAGTQYFWLSKDSYSFFPPLVIRNKRGVKATFSCKIAVHYIDIKKTVTDNTVTFEAENNLDFRLGTSPLRHTKIASENDIVAISRTSETEYELRVFKQGSQNYIAISPYALNFIGHQGKRYGYIDNEDFTVLTGISLPSVPKGGF